MNFILRAILVALGVTFIQPSAQAAVLHVDPENDPGGDGRNWTFALHDLREALAKARAGDEIWLKRGVHRLTEGFYFGSSDPYPLSFDINRPITIRGGFRGNETSPGQRPLIDPIETILDGDVRGDDGARPLSNPGDNADVVLSVNITRAGDILIEGVTVVGASKTGIVPGPSGGVDVTGTSSATFTLDKCLVAHNDGGQFQGSGVTIVNVQLVCRDTTIESNVTVGIFASASDVTIENCSVSENEGRGFYLSASGNRDLTIADSDFVRNRDTNFVGRLDVQASGSTFSGTDGAGIYLSMGAINGNPATSALIENCEFFDNVGDGAYCVGDRGFIRFRECNFSENQKGLWISTCEVVLEDCTIFRNAMNGIGNAMYITDGAVVSGVNVTIAENGPSFAGGIRIRRGPGLPGSVLMLANAVFHGNHKTALFIDGHDDFSEENRVILFNPIFVGNVNRGTDGGAIRNGGELQIYQGTFVGNEAVGSGDVIAPNTGGALDPTTTIVQSIFWRNDGSGADPVDIPLTAQSQNNFDGFNPRFVRDPDSGDGDWTTFADNDYGDLQPSGSSSVINRGEIGLLPPDALDLDGDGNINEFLPVDARFQRRINGGRPDIGAIESRRGDFSIGIRSRSLAPFYPNAWNDSYTGFWSGLVWHDGNQTEPAGSVRKMIVRLDRREGDRISGNTSVAVNVAGRVYRFRGGFDAAGVFSDTIELRGSGPRRPTATLELQTGLSSGENYLDGTFTNDAGEFRVVLAQSSFHPRRSPVVDEVGKYTSLLVPGSTWTTADPTGYGAGTVAVRPSGSVRLKGYLADGQRYSWAGRMANSRFIYLWKDLYRGKPRGYLAGRFQVREMELVSDMDGLLEWKKYPDEKARYFPEGFQLKADFVASRYDRYRGQRILLGVLDEAPNAALTIDLAGDSEVGLDDQAVEWTSRNVIRSGELGRALRLRGSAGSGLFSGLWTNESGEKIRIRAVAFQKQGFVLGNALGNAGWQGAVEIFPADVQRQ